MIAPPTSLAVADMPDTSQFVTEDDAPVDNILTEKNERLLTTPLHDSWVPPADPETELPRVFTVLANVGVFTNIREPPTVPDVCLIMDVAVRPDTSDKTKKSYFVWEHGKGPDIVIEIVSNTIGEELGKKRRQYARMRVPYYVVWDPFDYLHKGELQVFASAGDLQVPQKSAWFESLGLGLRLWDGVFEDCERQWLRWCDRDGVVIPLGVEVAREERARADQERDRADQERARAHQLLARLRAAGLEP